LETEQTGSAVAAEDNHGQHQVKVFVKSLKTNESVDFDVSEHTRLHRVWDEASEKLQEPRQPGDTFRCADGRDLSTELDATIEQLEEQRICVKRHFEIRGGSGGA
jgi:hypothetical protein